jgi:hypothetical protein
LLSSTIQASAPPADPGAVGVETQAAGVARRVPVNLHGFDRRDARGVERVPYLDRCQHGAGRMIQGIDARVPAALVAGSRTDAHVRRRRTVERGLAPYRPGVARRARTNACAIEVTGMPARTAARHQQADRQSGLGKPERRGLADGAIADHADIAFEFH